MRLIKRVTIIIILTYFFFLPNLICLADTCICPGEPDTPLSNCVIGSNCISPCTCTAGNPTCGNPPCTSGSVQLTNPLTGSTQASDIPTLLGKIINAVLGIVGSLALVMFIYGGFTWMTAAGNAEKVKKGKDILIWAAIGLAVIFSAYALVRFVFTGLGG